MKSKTWVGLTVRTGMDTEEWFGEIEGTVEQLLLKPDDTFVRLDHVVWLEARDEFEEPRIVRNIDNDLPFEHYIYVRKGDIAMVRPLRYAINPPDVVDE
jgi:hypothetical protein